ncbi:MAG: hypothetical protein ACP5H3_02460, partial [Candidatus Aenigmatarchaeota archaeon]
MEFVLKENELRIDAKDWKSFTTLEDSPELMKIIIQKLVEMPEIERITISEFREIEYNEEQVKMLKEIADIYRNFVFEKGVLRLDFFPERNQETKELIDFLLSDPIWCYVKVSMKVLKEKSKYA